MYEFLDEGLKYEDLNIYQKHKADWLEETDRYADATKKAYWINLNTKVNFMEVNKQKELYNWDKQEIVKLIKNTPTTAITTKIALLTTISSYIAWACERGFNYVGNPCDTIDASEISTVSEVAIKESYKTLQEFLDFILGLDCSDVDRAMFMLLRYGVKVDNVGLVRWEDIDRKEKVINVLSKDVFVQLPIDNVFLMMIDKAEACQSRIVLDKEINYVDNGYVIKVGDNVDWNYMDSNKIYNRCGDISRKNKINRISVPELNISRKYDLLIDILDENGEVTSEDIEKVLLQLDGSSTPGKKTFLKRNFELLSGITIENKKTGGRKKLEKIESKDTILEEVSKEDNVIQLSERM